MILISLTCTPVCRCSAGARVFDDASCCTADTDCVCASICTVCVIGVVEEKLSRIEINVRVSVETWRENNSGGISNPLARSWKETRDIVSVDVSRFSVGSFSPHATSFCVVKLKVSVATGRVDGFGGGFGGSLNNIY